MQGIYGFLFFFMTASANEALSLSHTHTCEHVHPLHLHALRAQMHLIAQRVTYTPCGTGNKPEKPRQSERERESKFHASPYMTSTGCRERERESEREGERASARVAHLGGTTSNYMARLWPRRLPNVAWHMANVRCIPIRPSEAPLASCHLPLGTCHHTSFCL